MRYMSLVVMLSLLTFPACAGHNAPVLVAQSGLAITQSIGQLQRTVKQLSDAQLLPVTVALNLQQNLVAVNQKLAPLPDLLRALEKLQASGDHNATIFDQAINILTVVGQDITVIITGVPATDTTVELINLVKAAQKTIQTTLVEVAKLKGDLK